MATIDELYQKYKSGQEAGAKAPASTTTSHQKVDTSAIDQLYKRWRRQGYEKNRAQYESYVQEQYAALNARRSSFADSYNSRYQNRSESTYYGDYDSWYQNVSKEKDSYYADVDAFLKEFAKYQEFYDQDIVNSIRTSLYDGKKGYAQALSVAQADSDYYNQFADEDAFNSAVDYSRKLSYDLAAGEQEIADLEAELDRYLEEEDFDWTDARARIAYDEGIAQIEAKIKEKKDYYDQAKEAQDSYAAAQRQDGYRVKYQGKSYGDIKALLSNMEDGEEKQWLQSYATTVMRPEDYDAEISEKESRLEELEAQYAKVQGMADQIGMGGETPKMNAAYKSLIDQYGTVSEIKSRIESLNDEIWNLKNGRKYNFLRENEDYADNSSDTQPVTSYDEATIYYLYNLMTPEEQADYFYLYNTQGWGAANDYLDYMKYALNQRKMQTYAEVSAEMATKAPVLSSILSVPVNLLSGVGLLDIAGQHIARGFKEAVTGEYGGPIDYNRNAMAPTVASSTIRGTVSQNIADRHGTIQLNAVDHPTLSKILNGKSLGDVYQLGMSMVDSAAIAAMVPVVGSAGTVLLGGSAGSQGVLDALENGATDDQALMMGILNGAFEMLFEKYSLESLMKVDPRQPVKAFFQQALAEGSEEFNTTLANTVADVLVMAENSDYQRSIREYMDKGMSQEEATRQALMDIAIGMGWDFVGGAASGGLMGLGSAAVQNAIRNKDAKRVYGTDAQSVVSEALEIDPGNIFATQMQQRLDDGKKLTGKQLRTLVEHSNDVLTANDMGAIRTAVRERLTELGETGDVWEITKALAKQAAGEELTRSEKRVIAESKFGNQVANELNPENIRSGRYDSAWAEKIGTNAINPAEYSRLADTGKEPNAGAQASVEPVNIGKGNTVHTQKIKPAESASAVSEDGKTTRVSTGEEVKIKEISSVKDGKLTFLLEDGSTADASDILYANEGEALVYEAVANMGVNASAANVLVNAYHTASGVSAYAYSIGIQEAYRYGLYNYPIREVNKGPFSSLLTDHQRNTAYKLGQMFGEEKAAGVESTTTARVVNKDQSTQKASGNWKKGTVSAANGSVSNMRRGFNSSQNEAYRILTTISEVTGIDVVLYESKPDADGVLRGGIVDGIDLRDSQGAFSWHNGKIYIDINAGVIEAADMAEIARYSMLRTFSHEFIHFIEKENPDGYDAFSQLVIDTMEKRGAAVDDMVKANMDEDPEMTREKAKREVVAEAMTDVLPQSSFVQELAEKHQNVFKQLLKKLKAFVSRIKAHFNAMGSNPSVEAAAIQERVDGAVRYVDGIVELFDKVAVQAVENYQARVNAQKNTATDGGVQYHSAGRNINEDKYFARQIDKWDGQDHGGSFRVGRVSDALKKVGIPDVDIWFDQSKAKKQLDTKAEVDKDIIKQIPTLLEHPVAISESYDNTVMVFGRLYERNTNNPIVVAVRINSTNRRNHVTLVNKIRSVGTRTHNLDKLLAEDAILYLGENKKETNNWFNALGRSTPFGGTRYGLIRSISFEAGKSNTKNYAADHLDRTATMTSRVLSDGVENEVGENGVQHQARPARYDYSKPFDQQIDDYKKGIIPKGDTLVVGATPDVYQSIGFNSLPMTINTTHVDYALNGTKDADHYLGESVLKQLPDSIKNPVAVFVSNTKGTTSVVSILNFTVNGKQTVVPIVVDGFGVNNRIVFDSNSITSVYGKTTAIKQLNQAVQDEANGKFALLYANKKEASSLLHRAGHQLSGSLIPRDGFIHSIRESASPVKPKFENVTESQQFKRWFGDWQKHPQNASKVVNADGTPKVMYHGTSAYGFTTFDTYGGRFGLFGKGSYFTEDKSVAESYTEKGDGSDKGVYEVYLNIRNPLDMDAPANLTAWKKAFQSAGLDESYLDGISSNEDAFRALKENLQDDGYVRWEAEEIVTDLIEGMGYDGITHIGGGRYNKGDQTKHRVYIAFEPTQIKSATDNIGTFDGNNPDIRYQRRTGTLTNRDILAKTEDATLRSDAEREWMKKYREKLEQSKEQNRKMEDLGKQIALIQSENNPKNQKKLRELKDEQIKTKNRIEIFETQISRLEKSGSMDSILTREKDRILKSLWSEYGKIPKGEKAVRDDTLPASTNGENKVSRTARTVKGASVTPEDFADLIDKDVIKNGLSYIPITNSETTKRAVEYISRVGWDAALYEWTRDVRAGKNGADMVAVGALLLNNAAKAGDKQTWLDVLHDYQMMGTRAGQTVQALRILKQLQPEDSLYMVKRSLRQMVEDMHLDITLDENLEKQYLEAKTDKERDKVLDQIRQSLADQIPSTWLDKLTALRYLNMLGNVRTQVRNVFGNLVMGLTVEVKNMQAAAMEKLVSLASGGKLKKTKSFAVSTEMMRSAMKDYKTVESIVSDGGKFNDPRAASTEFAKSVMNERTIFKNKLMEAYREVTNEATDRGDVLFSKYAYARALAGYLKANGVTDSDFSKVDTALLNDARMYAVREAQEATFHDLNAVSKALSKRYRGDNPFLKVVNIGAEGIMPFRKTPANIAVRAMEYSPLGAFGSIWLSAKYAAGKTSLANESGKIGDFARAGQEITGAQLINSWAKALTGTELFLSGILLASLGHLIGGPDDDDKLDQFESLNGQQNYALKIGDTYITIDWASPAAIPLLMGANLYQQTKMIDVQFKDIEKAFYSVTDPMIQMSMLQGINDVLKNIQYADSNVMQLAINAMVSYLTQGLTNSLAGQLERSFEDSRMTTYVDENSGLPNWMQKALGKASAKTPGLDYNQIPYINAWGEEEQNPNVVLNLIYNLLSPAYVSNGKEDAVSQELARLHSAQSDINVFPKTPSKSVSFTDKNGSVHEDYNLSAEEYVALARTQGQKQRELVENILSSQYYDALSDEEKASAIGYAYKYAKEYAQIEVLDRDTFSTNWMAEIQGDVAEAIIRRVTTGTNDKYTGLDISSADYVVDLLKGIEPEAGYTNVRPIQKMETVVSDEKLTGEEKETALLEIMTDNMDEKYNTAKQMGLSAESFVNAYRKVLDTSGEGTKQTLVDYFMKEMGLSLDDAEALYKLFK